jgi:phosphoribosylanthranilate isomerase
VTNINPISIKYCGFRTIEDAKFAATLPIQAIGFILVPDRKRTVSLEQVAEILPNIPKHIQTVGVFQNPSLVEVSEAIAIGLMMIQLHGQESPSFCQQIKQRWDIPIIKVFPESKIEEISFFINYIDIILLDHAAGGAGVPIDWSRIPSAKAIADQNSVPLWIAGGLNETNIADLYHNYEIDGIDLSSGIEIDGQKNNQKMIEIIERMDRHGKVRK